LENIDRFLPAPDPTGTSARTANALTLTYRY
jgi:hypothetical protein